MARQASDDVPVARYWRERPRLNGEPRPFVSVGTSEAALSSTIGTRSQEATLTGAVSLSPDFPMASSIRCDYEKHKHSGVFYACGVLPLDAGALPRNCEALGPSGDTPECRRFKLRLGNHIR